MHDKPKHPYRVSCKDGNFATDDGKLKTKVRNTENVAAVTPARECVDGQQAFAFFLRWKRRNCIIQPGREV